MDPSATTARMMDGLTIDDMISGNREGSLMEDEVVAKCRVATRPIRHGTIGPCA